LIDELPVKLLARLSWRDVLFTAVKNTIDHATDAGELYADRLPNTGEESIAWIGFDADPAAFALFYEARPRVMWIDQLYVQPFFRKEGMAGRLLNAIEQHSKALGYHSVQYGTRTSNTGSRRLGASRGYDEDTIGLSLNIAPPGLPLFAPAAGDPSDEIPF
jgi:GNAT superfamily N-acetyltransferase